MRLVIKWTQIRLSGNPHFPFPRLDYDSNLGYQAETPTTSYINGTLDFNKTADHNHVQKRGNRLFLSKLWNQLHDECTIWLDDHSDE